MSTYTQIATTTVQTPATATVTFSSLGSYTDLVIIASTNGSRATYGGDLHFRLNGDSGANYVMNFLRSQSSSATASSYTGLTEINLGGTMGGDGSLNFSLYYCHLSNYRNTSIFKTIHAFCNGAGSQFTQGDYTIGMWKSTAAVTSMTFLNGGGSYNLNTGTTISLYGILAA
jgi:hypothetical protein